MIWNLMSPLEIADFDEVSPPPEIDRDRSPRPPSERREIQTTKPLANRLASETLDIPWRRKPVETAKSGVEILPDGRVHCWIEHETLRGVTPKMLTWWFKHLEGEMLYRGRRLNRYRVWHPEDHLAVRYSKRNHDGSIGVGCEIHLTEMLGANPRYLTDVRTEIVKLDEEGFAHRPRFHGLRLARMDYAFAQVEGGTSYRNSLTVGATGRGAKLLNGLIRRFLFDEARGRAWIKHNIEEVGNFESFLPELYAREA